MGKNLVGARPAQGSVFFRLASAMVRQEPTGVAPFQVHLSEAIQRRHWNGAIGETQGNPGDPIRPHGTPGYPRDPMGPQGSKLGQKFAQNVG